MSAVVERPVVSLEVAKHVLWWFGDTNYGQQPGDFWSRQYAAFSAADLSNLERLRLAFPVEVFAWESVARKPWGLTWLIGLVKADLDHAETGLDFGCLS